MPQNLRIAPKCAKHRCAAAGPLSLTIASIALTVRCYAMVCAYHHAMQILASLFSTQTLTLHSPLILMAVCHVAITVPRVMARPLSHVLPASLALCIV
jgi:hypothetical protein